MSDASPWVPFRHRVFRGLWCAGAAVNLAIWMQTVGAAWIMTTLSPSALMVSLVQTAITLPVFLFALPGGVIADLVDRRKWLLYTQLVMFIAAAALCLLAYSDRLAAWSLLLLTFVLGTGSALGMSAWMIAMVDVLPREQVPAAVSLNGIATNAARALGPALAGALIAYWSAASVFLVIALCMFGVVAFIHSLKSSPPAGVLPPESFGAGVRSGLRYIRHTAVLSDALKQVFVFTSCASALWALMPLVARDSLGMDAGGYGMLMGFLGFGAVIAAFSLTRFYRRYSLRVLIVTGTLSFATSTVVAAFAHNRVLVCATLMLAGAGWMAVNATLSTVVQTYAANWVRARVASVYLLMLMGSMALGGAVWGALTEYLGLENSLLLSAVMLVLGLLLTRRGRVELGNEADFAEAQQTDRPLVASEIAHDDGPISVEISYQVTLAERDDFLHTANTVGVFRRRNGAQNWRLYRDLADPEHYIERFIVESWLDYLRQQSRLTRADQSGEQRLSRYRRCGNDIRKYICQEAGRTSRP